LLPSGSVPITKRAACALVLLTVAGCGGVDSTSSSPADGSSAVTDAPTDASSDTASPEPSPAASCSLHIKDDLIFWSRVPGLPDSALIQGDVNFGACKPSVDTLEQESPMQPGYCSALARSADNPGYNPESKPAPRPQHILVEYGPAC
jgi:hypothetical protein